MYYLVYGLLYLVSLLPFFILYRLSDLVRLVLYHVFGYRKKVIMYNLSVAFPEKTEEERRQIAKKFYRNLVDMFIEMLKMVSMTEDNFNKRCTADLSQLHEQVAAGRKVQLHLGHHINWEYASWKLSQELQAKFLVVYQPISNKAIDRIFQKMRGRFNATLVATTAFRSVMHRLFKSQYVIGLAADQNTSPATGFWMYFFTKPVPFIMGPDKGAVKNKTAVLFLDITKVKRGYYHIAARTVVENAAGMPIGELTRNFRDYLEETIRAHPENYLWSHRRWRHNYDPSLEKLWSDNKPPAS